MQNPWSTLLVAGLLSAAAANAQDEISYESTELVPGLYMLEGSGGFAGGNLGVLTGPDGVVLIDDGLDSLSATVLDAVAEAAGGPVDFVVNTHLHGDHVGNNAALHGQGARIVAHDNVRQRMGAGGAAPAALPELTFSDAMTFHLNGQRARAFHVRQAHTDGDAVIHFPDANVIHTGDTMFNGMFPFIDLDSGGSIDGYIDAQTLMIDLADDETQFIAGHGPLASRDDLLRSRDMLVDARARVQELLDQGRSREQILAANPLADYDDWSWSFITTEDMTETLIRGLSE